MVAGPFLTSFVNKWQSSLCSAEPKRTRDRKLTSWSFGGASEVARVVLRRPTTMPGAREHEGGARPGSSLRSRGQVVTGASSKTSVQSNASATAKATPFLGKMGTRVVAGLAMVGVVGVLVYAGHLAMCIAIIVVQVAIFNELVNLRYVRAKEAGMPMFRTTQWAWFATAML